MWDCCFYLNWEIAFLKIVTCRLNAKPGWGNTALYTERIIRNISLEWYPECELLNLPGYLWNRKSYRSAYVTLFFRKNRWWFFSAVPSGKWINILQNPLTPFPPRTPARGHTQKQIYALQRAISNGLSRQSDTRTSLDYLMGEKGQFVFSFSTYKSSMKKFILQTSWAVQTSNTKFSDLGVGGKLAKKVSWHASSLSQQHSATALWHNPKLFPSCQQWSAEGWHQCRATLAELTSAECSSIYRLTTAPSAFGKTGRNA